jgi:hypothetical protein
MVSRGEALKEWPPRAPAAEQEPASQFPSYPDPVVYSAENVPEQFNAWARSQRDVGTIITEDLAQDAMRGRKNVKGERAGGLLTAGRGLSRDTIRAWINTLQSDWVADRGVPPSRSRKV